MLFNIPVNKYAKILTLTSLLSVLASCSIKSDTDKAADNDSGSVQVLLPWYSSELNTFELKPFELTGVSSLRTLHGQFVEFFYAPSMQDDQLAGAAPKTQFIKSKNNYFVAKNTMSLEMATIYKIMQDMHGFDKEIGLESINTWPRKVGVSVRLSSSDETNNAFYDGKSDSFLFLNYTESRLPLAINSGVITHEYFHSLFNKLISSAVYENIQKTYSSVMPSLHTIDFYAKQKGLMETSDVGAEFFQVSGSADRKKFYDYEIEDLYTKTFVDGLNEGLADFWGYLYTKDIDFIGKSIPKTSSRILGKNTSTLISSFTNATNLKLNIEQLKNEVQAGAPSLRRKLKRSNFSSEELEYILYAELRSYSYSLGTQYANWAKLFLEATANEENQATHSVAVARAVVKALPSLRNRILENKKVLLNPEDVLMEISNQLETTDIKGCEFTQSFNKTLSKQFDYSCTPEADGRFKLEKQAKKATIVEDENVQK